jgi:hypothetical protein
MPGTHHKSTSNPITHRGVNVFEEESRVRGINMWTIVFERKLPLGEPQFRYLYRFITNEDSEE